MAEFCFQISGIGHRFRHLIPQVLYKRCFESGPSHANVDRSHSELLREQFMTTALGSGVQQREQGQVDVRFDFNYRPYGETQLALAELGTKTLR